MPTRADLALRLRVVANSQRVQTGTRARTILDEAVDSLIKADEELAVARAIVNESIRGDRVIHQKLDDAERKLAAAKSVAANAVETLARIASLDISATRSIEDLVAPWRRPNA